MPHNYPLLFALDGSQAYASRVAHRLGCELSELEERNFEDGEHKTRPLEQVCGRQAIVFQALYADAEQSVNDKLCRLLFFCAALKDAGARRVQVIAPYLCYARKERRTKAQDPIISRYVASLLETCGVDHLLALEVHNVAAFDNAFRIPTHHLDSAELFASHFSGLNLKGEITVVAPDSGGTKRAELFRCALARRMGRPVGNAYMEKFRSNDALTGALLVGDVQDKIVIIFDDLISTGETLMRAGEACRAAGAKQIFAAATHGLFCGSTPLLDSALFERIVVSDSVPPWRLDPLLVVQRLQILDSSAYVAALLVREFGFANLEQHTCA